MTLDYRDLLRKYIGHVADCEGITYIGYSYDSESAARFTDDELAALRELAAEAHAIRFPEHTPDGNVLP